MNPNPIETWLSEVAYSHSNSNGTRIAYKKAMEMYCEFTGLTPEQILSDYENMDEKRFKHKHTLLIKEFLTELFNRGMENTSVRTRIGAVKSFYTYKDLPIGKISQAQERITYHNRDIEAKEIAKIMSLSSPRERAFYAVMVQSGLRPCAISKLRLNMIEDLNKEQKSYLINVPATIEKGKFGGHPSFIGEEARKYLKSYLSTRTDLKTDSLLFCTHNKPENPLNIKNLSRSFQTTAKGLREAKELNYKTLKKGKPSELRLYTLRKFFKRKSKDMGDEDTNYLMGHVIVGSNANYAPQNPEYYRKRYEDKALEFLRLETPTPSDTKELLEAMETKHKNEIETIENKNKELTKRLEKMELLMELYSQTMYKQSINNLTKPPEEAEKERMLTPQAKKIIFNEKDTRTWTEKHYELSELFSKIQESTGQEQTEAILRLKKLLKLTESQIPT